MSYTVLHTHRKPNRYYKEVYSAEVSLFLSGVETPPDNSKKGPTQEQEKACIKGITAAKEIAKQGDVACKSDQENAPNSLNYFNLDGYTPPALESKNTGIHSTPSIPGAPGINPNAQSQVVPPVQGSREGSDNGLPSGMTQNGGGPQQLTVGTKTWINGILQP